MYEPLAFLPSRVPLILIWIDPSAFAKLPENLSASLIVIAGKPFSVIQNVSPSVHPYWTRTLNLVTAVLLAVKLIGFPHCILPLYSPARKFAWATVAPMARTESASTARVLFIHPT